MVESNHSKYRISTHYCLSNILLKIRRFIIAVVVLLTQQKVLKIFKFTHNINVYYSAAENPELSLTNSKIDTSSNNNKFNTSHFFDVTAAVNPGVYAIIDETSGYIYFGESDIICARLGTHKKALEKSQHENFRLQQAWSKDSTRFKFVVLEYGPAWQDVNVRRTKEQELISAHAGKCFNYTPSAHGYLTPVIIDGIRYESLKAGARAIGTPETTLRRAVANSEKLNVVILEKEEYGCTPVFINVGEGGKNGDVVVFPSIISVVNEGFATTRTQVSRRIKSNNYPDWRYAALDDTGKAIRRPYKLKPGEISYEQ